MARRKSRLSRTQRQDALAQLQSYRQEENQQTEHPKNSKPEVSNYDLLNELKQEQREAKRNKKAAKKTARSNARDLRQEEGPKTKISFAGAFQPGELIMISKRACKRYCLDQHNLFEGATGVIVEMEDKLSYNGVEEARYVQVMGPNGLERWDVRWCTHLEEDED